MELPLPPGLHYVTPLTAGRNAVAVGRHADAWAVEPVGGLRAERKHDEAELSWFWPRGATDALVRWPGGELRQSRRAYGDEGGAVISVGPAETTIEVRAVYARQGRRVVSSCAREVVPARDVAVSYRVRGASRWRRELTFELTAERAVRLPPLVVVRGTAARPPGDAFEGEIVARQPARDIEPGRPVSFSVPAAGGPDRVACFVDPEAAPSQATAVVLYPAPAYGSTRMKPARRAGVHCPYCYAEISGEVPWFRCAGQPGPTGKRCAQSADEALRARTGFAGVLPPAFAASRPGGPAQCPGCGGKTAVAVCPVCHSRLPVHFGKVGSHLIVPVGAKEAGKTVFMTVLVHELMHRTGEELNAALTGADDYTRHRFPTEYERPLYRESRLPSPTTTAAGEHNRPPFVFRFTSERSRRLVLGGPFGGNGQSGSRDPRRTLLSFLDTAGEDLRTQQSMEDNVRCLGAAGGILLLLDPLQMRGARELAAEGTRLPALAGDDEPATVLQNFTGHPARGDWREGPPADRPAAGHRVHEDRRAAAEPARGEPAAAAPAARSVLRRARQPGCPPGDPRAARPLARRRDRPDRPAELPHVPLLRGVRARRDAHGGQPGLRPRRPALPCHEPDAVAHRRSSGSFQ